MSRFAKLHLGGSKHGKDMALCVAQVAQKELTTACLRQSELHAGVNGADMVEHQRSFRHLQDVAGAGRGKLHAQRLVNGEVGDVHRLRPKARLVLLVLLVLCAVERASLGAAGVALSANGRYSVELSSTPEDKLLVAVVVQSKNAKTLGWSRAIEWKLEYRFVGNTSFGRLRRKTRRLVI